MRSRVQFRAIRGPAWTVRTTAAGASCLVRGGALGGTRTPNLLIRSQMLYPLSYERSHCSILHPEPSRRVLETCGRAYSGVKAPGFLIRKPGRDSGDLVDSVRGLFRLDPADQVVPADRIQ